MRTIKRYVNRKLYDTRAKRYVRLEELAQLAFRGEAFRVVDHASGEDLTQQTLAQIIVEQEKNGQGARPRVSLAALLQASNQALSQLRQALPWPETLRAQVDSEVQSRIDLLVKWGDLTPDQGDHLVERLWAAGQQRTEAPELNPAVVAHELRERGVPTRADLQALQDRLADLAAEIERLAAGNA